MANRLMRWFDCEHLPPDLRSVASPIRDVARHLDALLPEGAEKTAIEAKDCLVRAAIEARPGSEQG